MDALRAAVMIRVIQIVGQVLIAALGSYAAAWFAGAATFFLYLYVAGGSMFCTVDAWCMLTALLLGGLHTAIIFLAALTFGIQLTRGKSISLRQTFLVATPIFVIATALVTGVILGELGEPGWFYAAWYAPATALGFVGVVLAMSGWHQIWIRAEPQQSVDGRLPGQH
jgi:hypothetical protein